MPRHAEVFGGLVNAIGLQGPGVEAFATHYVGHFARTVGSDAPPLIVNIWGGSVEEYAEVAARLTQVGAPVAALECNVSCPNVKEGGHTFGQDPAVLEKVVAAVRSATRLPLIVKLAPNVPDVSPYVAACEESGADALALINTIPAMVIDVETRRPVLGNVTGGLSGRCVHPVAVKAVWDAYRVTKLPILAMGGVYEPRDAVELMLAGATAVAVGTATFSDPSTAERVADGIAAYCARHGFPCARDIVGAAHPKEKTT
jgi:dihydroorotate dehydrogenase (NAD+) catalytic subunit